MSRRTIALVAAIVLAAVATIALLSYVQGIEDRTLKDQEPVTVFKAKDAIPAGVSAEAAQSQGLIETVSVPQVVRPFTAITTLDEISGKVAQVVIPAGEILITDRWVAPGQAGGGLSVPQKKVAMSIEVDIPPGVAGFIRQNDRISVVAHLQVTEIRARATAAGATASASPARAQFIVQNIQVLAVGQRIITTTEQGQSESTEAPQGRVLVTVAVTPGEAERLVFAVLEGDVYFTLLPNGAKSVNTPGRTARNIFPR
jgi:pilus assembly protein CpaB